MIQFFQSKKFGWIMIILVLAALIFRVISCINEPKISKENRTATLADTVNYKDKYNAEHLRVVQLISDNALSKI